VLVDAVTSQCAANGHIQKGDFLKSTYRAKVGATGEPNNPGITFISDLRTMTSYFRTSGANANTMHGSGNYTGYVLRANVTSIPSPNQQNFTGKFNLKINPTTVKANTDTVTVDGWIDTWRGIAGCKVTFRGAYRLNNF
jgi:hypothetical protein